MCDTSQDHHLLHVDELRNVPLFSYFLGEVSIESHMGTGREKSFGLVAAVEERELFGPLTWMNCWSNVFAGNTWIVYINMINIALINQIRVIYCCFSHLASTGKLWRISEYNVYLLTNVYRKFWVFSGSLNLIMVLWSTTNTQRALSAPIWFFTGCEWFRFSPDSCWGGKSYSVVQWW